MLSPRWPRLAESAQHGAIARRGPDQGGSVVGPPHSCRRHHPASPELKGNPTRRTPAAASRERSERPRQAGGSLGDRPGSPSMVLFQIDPQRLTVAPLVDPIGSGERLRDAGVPQVAHHRFPGPPARGGEQSLGLRSLAILLGGFGRARGLLLAGARSPAPRRRRRCNRPVSGAGQHRLIWEICRPSRRP
jgi:hypothetical protein